MPDAFEKFARDMCEFLDAVSDVPLAENLVFSVEVKKVNRNPNRYHLKNPVLKAASEDKPLILKPQH